MEVSDFCVWGMGMVGVISNRWEIITVSPHYYDSNNTRGTCYSYWLFYTIGNIYVFL